jgi:hypothetical protein
MPIVTIAKKTSVIEPKDNVMTEPESPVEPQHKPQGDSIYKGGG